MSLTRATSPLNPLRALFPGHRQADARFQHVLEHMPGAALVVVPRTGQFVYLNSRAAALTGWTREELLTRALAEVVSAPEVLAHFYTLEPGNTRQLVGVPLRTRFGPAALIDARLSALEDGGETLVLVLATPAEERLAQERERARHAHILAHLPDFLRHFDTPTPEALPAALQTLTAIFQADSIALFRNAPDAPGFYLETGHGLPALFPPIIGPSEAQRLTVPWAWAHTQRSEGFLPQALRVAGWTHVLSQPVGRAPDILGALLLGFRPGNPPGASTAIFLEMAAQQVAHLIEQITRHARLLDTQRLAFHLTHQLDAVTALISEGIVTVNSSGAVNELSAAGARMLGYRAEDVIGLQFEDVLCADDGLIALIRSTLSGQDTQPREKEGVLHRRNGEKFPVIARMQPLPAPNGGCVLVLHDLTRERADEVQRQHVDHLAYVGQSIQAFAHEVRAPLNNISVGVQYLATRPATDETQLASLSKIQAETARLSQLMNDMLAWAKPVEPRLAPLDLGNLLRRLVSRWSAKFQQRNDTHTLTLPETCPPLLGDPLLLERVFVNLIENALQAMPAGGHLALSIAVVERGPAGRVLEARIGDSGPGIPEEHRRRIFDPYFTTKADGSGLGLAICKRIVTVHRGAIAVESFPGAGTIFTLTLPLPPDEPPAPETPA